MDFISADEARQFYSYDGETGQLYRRKKNGDKKPVGFRTAKGYVMVKHGGRKIYAHRLIWLIKTGESKDKLIHLNGDLSDNSWRNLATYKQPPKKAEKKQGVRRCAGDIQSHIYSSDWAHIGTASCKDGLTWLVFAGAKDMGKGWTAYKVIRKERAPGRSTYWLNHKHANGYWCHTKDRNTIKKTDPDLFAQICHLIGVDTSADKAA